MRGRMLVGLQEIADYLNGDPRPGVTRKWIGPKIVKQLIKTGGLPAKQIRRITGPWTITEDALIEWHRNYEEK